MARKRRKKPTKEQREREYGLALDEAEALRNDALLRDAYREMGIDPILWDDPDIGDR